MKPTTFLLITPLLSALAAPIVCKFAYSFTATRACIFTRVTKSMLTFSRHLATGHVARHSQDDILNYRSEAGDAPVSKRESQDDILNYRRDTDDADVAKRESQDDILNYRRHSQDDILNYRRDADDAKISKRVSQDDILNYRRESQDDILNY